MQKGYFLVYSDLNDNSGVNKKIKSQIDVLRDNGIDIQPKQLEFKTNLPGYKLLYRMPFTNLSPVWKVTKDYENIDFIYLRRPFFCNFWFLRFLKRLKALNPGIKIIYELPTYPYDGEMLERKKNIPIYIKDYIARKDLHKYVDKIACLTGENTIFSVKTLQISNGYDFEKQTLRNIRYETEDINIAVVALFASWHGYERLIKGLSNYYTTGGNRKVFLHFAGDGPELAFYRKLAVKLNISDSCIFYGMQDHLQLNNIYDQCDLAAASFGCYKKNIYFSRELKTREYLAKGLPILFAERSDVWDIDELKPYLCGFPNDDSAIDINKVIAFYDKLYLGKNENETAEMCKNIRRIAQNNLDMNKAMKSVIDYIKTADT